MSYEYTVSVPGSIRHIKFILEIQQTLSALKINHKQAADIETQETQIIFSSNDDRLEKVINRLSKKTPVQEVIAEYQI